MFTSFGALAISSGSMSMKCMPSFDSSTSRCLCCCSRFRSIWAWSNAKLSCMPFSPSIWDIRSCSRSNCVCRSRSKRARSSCSCWRSCCSRRSFSLTSSSRRWNSPSAVFTLGAARTPSGLTKRPCISVQSKYRLPFTLPSFLPTGSSRLTPTHMPPENSASPMKRTVAGRAPRPAVHFSDRSTRSPIVSRAAASLLVLRRAERSSALAVAKLDWSRRTCSSRRRLSPAAPAAASSCSDSLPNSSSSFRKSSSLLSFSCWSKDSISAFSFVNLAIKSTLECSFLRALVLTSLQRDANSKVPTVSSKLLDAGLTHARSAVRLLPMSASFSKSVNFESRKGGALVPPGFVKSEITRPSVLRDWLMPMPSFKRMPSEPDFFWRSLPARSTKCNFARLSTTAPSLDADIRTCTVKMPCDRDDCAFICVAPTARRLAPKSSNSSASAKSKIGDSVRPATKAPSVGCERTCSSARPSATGPLARRSKSRSL
mmetsp:Transcript_21362/g.63816  ORF Transcript_21362/g.63816 Transcript_21362/m.63816 type:complete len:485 (-) Transcript_21362:461-1915(-)